MEITSRCHHNGSGTQNQAAEAVANMEQYKWLALFVLNAATAAT